MLRDEPPTGPLWVHEIKFDGWRMQLHKRGNEVHLYSRKGNDFTGRFPTVAGASVDLPCNSAILDAEVVATNDHGRPDFAALHERPASSHVLTSWVFDLLYLGGRGLPLDERRLALAKLMEGAKPPLQLSETFDDPIALLKAADEFGQEGIMSKRRDLPYRSGTWSGWVKVKTATCLAANRERGKMFVKPGLGCNLSICLDTPPAALRALPRSDVPVEPIRGGHLLDRGSRRVTAGVAAQR